MRRVCSFVALTGLFLAAASVPAFAGSGDPMSPAEVVAIDRVRDGTVVTVEGEAIGEALNASGGGRWVNILGDGVGLGIWMSEEMAEEVESFGGYKQTGDIVRVTGVLNIACDEHAGEFDVHASGLTVVSRGAPRETEIVPLRGLIGVAGIVLAVFLWRSYTRRRERGII